MTAIDERPAHRLTTRVVKEPGQDRGGLAVESVTLEDLTDRMAGDTRYR